MRQHVNPLSRFFQEEIQIPEPYQLFENPRFPLHLDIGCAKGKFVLQMASANPEMNFLGIEIRQALVKSANRERKRFEINNANFFFCNANVSLETWLQKLPSGSLESVSIQFPDPWFKRRHKKRSLLQRELLVALAENLAYQGKLFIQTDVISVMESIDNMIQSTGFFSGSFSNLDGGIMENPYGITTEREEYAIKKQVAIYRTLYIRENIK